MKKYLVALLIAVLTVGAADAQFGKLTKGLGKKIENAVKKETVKAKEEAKQKSQQEAARKRGQDALDKLRQEQEAKKAAYQSSSSSSSSSSSTQQEAKAQQKPEDVLQDYEFVIDSYGTFDHQAVAFKGGRYDPDAQPPYGEYELGIYRFARKIKYWDECLKNGYYDPENFTAYRNFNVDNGLYYVYRLRKAAEQGDTEIMTGYFLTRATWCINNLQGMLADGRYEQGKKEIIEQLLTDYNALLEKYDELIWAGKPENPMSPKDCTTPEKKVEYTQHAIKVWDWCLDKADAALAENKLNTAEFYIGQALGYRYTNIAWGYATGEEPGFAEFDARMGNLYAGTSSEFQKENKFLTVAEAQAAHKADVERWAREAAEKKAREEAEIEANTRDWPESNMPELHSQALAAIKAKYPNKKIYRISIANDHWENMYKGLHLDRREVLVWVETDHPESGRRIAEEHYVAQYYSGGFGKTQHSGFGHRFFYVRQKK